MTIDIYGKNWNVIIVDRKSIEGCDGRTIPTQMEIKIANDMNYISTELTFIHEVVHAILDSQGRCYERNMKVEYVCEFVAWNHDLIHSLTKQFRNMYEKPEIPEPLPIGV